MVAIIDYDAGNIKSVEKAVAFLGKEAVITRKPGEILGADHVILPGVGNFGDAMKKLEKYGLIPVIREVIEKQIPFLGICLGLYRKILCFYPPPLCGYRLSKVGNDHFNGGGTDHS